MEEFKKSLNTIDVHPLWIGIPGKSIRSRKPETFDETLKKLNEMI